MSNDTTPSVGLETTPDPRPVLDDGSVGQRRSLWSDAWRSLRKNPYFIIGATLSFAYTLMAIYPPLFTGFRAAKLEDCNLRNSKKPPSGDAWFGYDVQGCDLAVFTPHGARTSMSIALIVVVSVAVLGILLGSLAGYYGGWFDTLVSRLAEVFYAVPAILGAMLALLTLFSGSRSVFTVSLALIVFGWMTPARLIRASVLSVRESDYIAAAKALGAPVQRIITRHILPNSVAPLIIYLTITFGMVIAAEASLSFIGIGLALPAISWGLQINTARQYLELAPHMLWIPSLFVSFAVLSFVLMGDALREALDPKSK